MPVTSQLVHLARRASVVLLAGGLLVAAGGPAGADVPEFWAEPYDVDPLHTVLVFVGIPLLLFVTITALVIIPGVVKGERFTPGGQATADQWFGGPRTGTAELPAPDAQQAQDPESGGASGRW